MAMGPDVTEIPDPIKWIDFNSDAKVASSNGGGGLQSVLNGSHGNTHFFVRVPDWAKSGYLEIRERRTVPGTSGAGAKVYVLGVNKNKNDDKDDPVLCNVVNSTSTLLYSFGASIFSSTSSIGFSETVRYELAEGMEYVLVIINTASAPFAGGAKIQGRFMAQSFAG